MNWVCVRKRERENVAKKCVKKREIERDRERDREREIERDRETVLPTVVQYYKTNCRNRGTRFWQIFKRSTWVVVHLIEWNSNIWFRQQNFAVIKVVKVLQSWPGVCKRTEREACVREREWEREREKSYLNVGYAQKMLIMNKPFAAEKHFLEKSKISILQGWSTSVRATLLI